MRKPTSLWFDVEALTLREFNEDMKLLYGAPVIKSETEWYVPAEPLWKEGLVMVHPPKRTQAFQFIWATLHFTAAILHFGSGVYHAFKLARSYHARR